MPKEGFKVVAVREKAYDLAKRITEDDGQSLTDVVSQAIEEYGGDRRKLHREVLDLIKLLKKTRGSSGS
ncbi:MAG: hypothetical protein OEY24_06315 [Candidatus Bathyarchaeota archaeon]|nr:hypothetical protein [Candidatus Bathyarchaeota archaeon]MDH5495300.1 hypothetical protein [Candidatus Bathyarchaeota archaeon]